jgi:hypothetical protein
LTPLKNPVIVDPMKKAVFFLLPVGTIGTAIKTTASQIGKLFVLKYFFLGISMAFLIQASGSCRKDPITPEDPVDVGKINEGAKLAESAFISGDPIAIINILTEEARGLYDSELPQVDKNQLTRLGEALKTRTLKVYTGLYAEYEYEKGGVTYTFAMAEQEDGSWKLMRF